eukprot:2222870-Pyramimonas_sp.AAC.1
MLEASGTLLAFLRALLGRSWGSLGRNWGRLGALRGASRASLGPSWRPSSKRDGGSFFGPLLGA